MRMEHIPRPEVGELDRATWNRWLESTGVQFNAIALLVCLPSASCLSSEDCFTARHVDCCF